MGRPYQILLPLFSLFLVRVDLTDLYPVKLPVKVLKVYDGDTVLVKYRGNKMRIRLSKIDAPEMGQPFLGGGDAGLYAKKCLEKLMPKNGLMTLKIHGTDMYGRTLGDLDDLNFQLIQEGCSSLYPYASFESEGEKFRYLRALREARSLRKGVWNLSGYLQPKIWRKTKKRSAHRR